jgi:hypothetical protein
VYKRQDGQTIWAKSAVGPGGPNGDATCSAAIDDAGNVIIAGNFDNTTISFDTYTLTNADITGNTWDVFLAKYDAVGNVLYAKSFGGQDRDKVTSIVVDASGNSLLTGTFRGPTISFGTTTLINTDNTGNTVDIYLAKLGASSVINELEIPMRLTVFPNPSAGRLAIQSPLAFGEIILMQVYNYLGQLKQTWAQRNDIDISSYESGLYFVVATNIRGERLSCTIVKE